MFDVLGRITELRNERGWSIYKLAKEAKIPQSTVATWFTKNRQPSVEDIEKICISVGITLAEFFKEEIGRKENKLLRMRNETGLSVNELSHLCDLPVEELVAFEQGKKDISRAQFAKVKRIANALGCTTEEIVD